MAVTVQIGEWTATVNEGIWKSDDFRITNLFSQFVIQLRETYAPWPDYALAEMAAKALDGKIVEATDPPKFVAGRVY